VSTYQDVVNASLVLEAWALTEAAGTDFAPYTGSVHLTGAGVNQYQQAGPNASMLALHLNPGKLTSASNLPFTKWFTMECWFHIDSTARAGNCLLMYLGGNSSANGWGIYIAPGSNAIHFFWANPVRDITTGVVLPANQWHLLQIGNLSGATGEMDLAFDGRVIAQDITPNSQTLPAGGYGFGGDNTFAGFYPGLISMPAVYVTQQSPLAWFSRFQAVSDPNAAVLNSLTGPGQAIAGGSGILSQILASVRKQY
jgi:hypothetical protein